MLPPLLLTPLLLALLAVPSALAEPGVLPEPETPAAPTGFTASSRALTREERVAMVGVSWHEGCPVPPEMLRRLDLMVHHPDGTAGPGALVVAVEAVEPLTRAFQALWDANFPIARMEPIEAFAGNDDASMAANNTSAFNCRPIGGGTTLSQHAYGLAVDVNPLWNPYIRTGADAELIIQPPEGRAWADRHIEGPGVIAPDGAAVAAFRAAGWRWGGLWKSLKDYQHFSANGK